MNGPELWVSSALPKPTTLRFLISVTIKSVMGDKNFKKIIVFSRPYSINVTFSEALLVTKISPKK